MSDGEFEGPLVIWGIPVPTKSNGRKMWPTEIKTMAAEQVAAGKTVAEIARETTANESLVGKWVRDHRGGKTKQRHPSITEVVAVSEFEEPVRASSVATCEIQLGDVRVTIGPGYPAGHLSEILRAVRASR